MTDDVRKLLGGYATGTLSDEEKQLLYDAALRDDDLFAALADEHALKELLDDSNVRAQLLRATEEPKFTVAGAFREWLERPKAKALVATGAVLLAIIAFKTGRESMEEKHEQVAEVRQPAAEPERPVVPPAQPKESPAPQRKAAKLKVEKDAPVMAREAPASAPQPPSAPARGVVGGVVGGVIGGVPAASQMRYKSQETADAAAPIAYELLGKQADGEFRPVAADSAFAEGDVVQVRVTSRQNGAVALAVAGRGTVSQMVTAGQTVVLPATGGIAIAPDTRMLTLTFSAAERTSSFQIPIPHRGP
jgi:hypothetical protein